MARLCCRTSTSAQSEANRQKQASKHAAAPPCLLGPGLRRLRGNKQARGSHRRSSRPAARRSRIAGRGRRCLPANADRNNKTTSYALSVRRTRGPFATPFASACRSVYQAHRGRGSADCLLLARFLESTHRCDADCEPSSAPANEATGSHTSATPSNMHSPSHCPPRARLLAFAPSSTTITSAYRSAWTE